MPNDNMAVWNQLKTPPPHALKTIGAGRLKGKTDINPQWRFEAMTELLGPVGDGWKYTIDNLWLEPIADGQIVAFAQVSIYMKLGDGTWSDPIPGIGGNKLVEQESSGLHVNDECYKMAVTDALSVAMKALGVAADVYAGQMDGSKYSRPTLVRPEGEAAPGQPVGPPLDRPAANGDNMTVTWGKKDGPWYGKTFEEIWASGPKGHSYLHWVAEEAEKMNPATKAAARKCLDRQKVAPEMATTEDLVKLRELVEDAGADLEAYGEELRKVDAEYGGVPMAWAQAVADKMQKRMEEESASAPYDGEPGGYSTPMLNEEDIPL